MTSASMSTAILSKQLFLELTFCLFFPSLLCGFCIALKSTTEIFSFAVTFYNGRGRLELRGKTHKTSKIEAGKQLGAGIIWLFV